MKAILLIFIFQLFCILNASSKCDTLRLRITGTKEIRNVVICPEINSLDTIQSYFQNKNPGDKIIFSLLINRNNIISVEKIILKKGTKKIDLTESKSFFQIYFLEKYTIPESKETDRISIVFPL